MQLALRRKHRLHLDPAPLPDQPMIVLPQLNKSERKLATILPKLPSSNQNQFRPRNHHQPLTQTPNQIELRLNQTPQGLRNLNHPF